MERDSKQTMSRSIAVFDTTFPELSCQWQEKGQKNKIHYNNQVN